MSSPVLGLVTETCAPFLVPLGSWIFNWLCVALTILAGIETASLSVADVVWSETENLPPGGTAQRSALASN